jgi:hypothetical protein
VLHSTLAIGALSLYNYYPSQNPSPSNPKRTSNTLFGSVPEYAFKQYNLAIQTLNARLGDSTNSWELAILGSILFVNIEVLQGYESRAKVIIESAMEMLRSFPKASTTGPTGDLDLLKWGLAQLDLQVHGLEEWGEKAKM